MKSDQEIVDQIRRDMEYVQARISAVAGTDSEAEFVLAMGEIASNAVNLAGSKSVPVPPKVGRSDFEQAVLLTAVVSANVSAFVRRPHDVTESDSLARLADAVVHVRVGVEQAT